MLKKFYYLIILCVLLAGNSIAQKGDAKQELKGITAEDLNQKIYSIDSNANAIVLADIGNTHFVGNKSGWFDYVFQRTVRIKILQKAGYDAATFKINLYSADKRSETLSDLKALTYNIEDAKILTSALDNKSVFTDNINANHIQKKFTLPDIKEGSIIELSYTVTSPFDFELQPWYFQTDYPCLWSEYKVAIPQLLNYSIIKHGFDSFFIKKNSQTYEHFAVSQDPLLSSTATATGDNMYVGTPVSNYDWAMKDVPALKAEAFVTSLRNYNDEIEFQLISTYNGETADNFFSDWGQVGKFLLRSSDFGGALAENLNIPAITKIAQENTDDLSKAKSIYYYIKENFNCIDHNGFLVKTSLQDVLKKKEGNVGEINLLLINTLHKNGIIADPVILSTRDNGFTFGKIPVLEKFNYLICRANINGDIYYLDASQPNLGFGKLSEDCYNDSGRVVSEMPEAINFSANSLKENNVTTAFITNSDAGMTGAFTTYLGYEQSYELRNKLSTIRTEDYFNNMKKDFPLTTEFSNTTIDSLGALENPLIIKYNAQFNLGDDDVIYFNPLFSYLISKNPFQSAVRQYPVEMPYPVDETYVMNMEVPKGYTIDALPKSTHVNFNATEGMFEYIIGKTDAGIQLRCRLVLNKANFSPEDYQTLRDFYSFIVEKEGEQIVFKKVK